MKPRMSEKIFWRSELTVELSLLREGNAEANEGRYRNEAAIKVCSRKERRDAISLPRSFSFCKGCSESRHTRDYAGAILAMATLDGSG